MNGVVLHNEIIDDNYIEIVLLNELIQRAHLDNTPHEFEITDYGLLIKVILKKVSE